MLFFILKTFSSGFSSMSPFTSYSLPLLKISSDKSKKLVLYVKI